MNHRWIDETQPEEARTVNYLHCAGCGLIKRSLRYIVRPANAEALYFVLDRNTSVQVDELEVIPRNGWTIRDARPDEIETCSGKG